LKHISGSAQIFAKARRGTTIPAGVFLRRRQIDFRTDIPGMIIDTVKAAKDDPEVNYRYSSSPERACGFCLHFEPPGGCQLVAGVTRPCDSCNLFEPDPYGGMIQAELPEPVELPHTRDLPIGPAQTKIGPIQAIIKPPQPVQAQIVPQPVQAEMVGSGKFKPVQATLAEAGKDENWITIGGTHVIVGSPEHDKLKKKIQKTRQATKDTARGIEDETYRPRMHTGQFVSQGKTHKALQKMEADKPKAFDLPAAREEMKGKTDQELEIETAWKWGARAAACYELFESTKETNWLLKAEDYRHETLEHAALAKDNGETLVEIEKLLDKAKGETPVMEASPKTSVKQ
jgi:hypothetical protein